MEKTLQRKVDWAALASLVVVTLVFGITFWLFWTHFQNSSAIQETGRARGYISDFGKAATGLSAIAIPMMVWLFRKTFFGQYRLTRLRKRD